MPNDPRDDIATIIADNRQGEVPRPTADHVDRWARQLSEANREHVLREMVHILGKAYVSKADVQGFLTQVATSDKLAGDDPASFWKGVSFLRLQRSGNSQRDMLSLMDDVLHQAFGFKTAQCGADPQLYLYLDDGVFSGGRIKSDLKRWVEEHAPQKAEVAIVVMASHTGGSYYADTQIGETAKQVGKTINVTWWHSMRIEDRRAYTDTSDVLRPKAIPTEAEAYIADLDYPPVLRSGNHVGSLGLFSSADARDVIEQEFLKSGIAVRRRCPLLGPQMRPLGSTWLHTPGFGTMFVTYRNIANNAPLVLWAGNPWYPLFPRKTN